jgi:hypothetical protein
MYDLRNVLTLQVGLAQAYERFDVWFDPIEVPQSSISFCPADTWFQGAKDQYTVRKIFPVTWSTLPKFVTFTNAFPDRLALPSRQYLALHAACAKAVCMTGAAELIYSLMDDYEQTEVLSNDGSSGELLGHLLAGAALSVH